MPANASPKIVKRKNSLIAGLRQSGQRSRRSSEAGRERFVSGAQGHRVLRVTVEAARAVSRLLRPVAHELVALHLHVEEAGQALVVTGVRRRLQAAPVPFLDRLELGDQPLPGEVRAERG